jgi:hypothetical protein
MNHPILQSYSLRYKQTTLLNKLQINKYGVVKKLKIFFQYYQGENIDGSFPFITVKFELILAEREY